MLVRFEAGKDFIYINPDRVFAIKEHSGGMYKELCTYYNPQTREESVQQKWIEGTTIIWSDDERNYIIVDEPLEQVAEKLNKGLERKRS